jgi:predicted enzyme related to lactoylglutathione lyase
MASRPPLTLNCVMVDCQDVGRVSTFWSSLLGRPVVSDEGPYVFLARQDGVAFGFQPTAQAKVGKNRLHVDLSSDDPAGEVDRVVALGGRRVEGYEGGGFLVMADPEGNEFCIVPSEPFAHDDEGNAHYLEGPPPGGPLT